MKILILGGTGEARQLADRLVALGHDITTALAGRTGDPMLPQGAIRRGGFGGPQGLARYLRDEGFDWLIDATHPYAAVMSRHAVEAAHLSSVQFLRLERPAWTAPADAPWIEVADAAEAAAALPAGARVLLTVGQRDLSPFFARGDDTFIVRVIEAPTLELPEGAQVLLSRPPYDVEGEMALMAQEGVTHLVSKNAGGPQTAAKLEAARLLGVSVIMIARPALAPAPSVPDIDAVLARLHAAGS